MRLESDEQVRFAQNASCFDLGIAARIHEHAGNETGHSGARGSSRRVDSIEISKTTSSMRGNRGYCGSPTHGRTSTSQPSKKLD